MRKLNKKLLTIPLASFLALSVFLGFSPKVSADDNLGEAGVRDIKANDIGSRSVNVPVIFGDFHDRNVTVTAKITNENTGQATFQKFDVSLNENGKGRIFVTGLKPSTQYGIKVKMIRTDDGDFRGNPTDYSDSHFVWTKPASAPSDPVTTAGTLR